MTATQNLSDGAACDAGGARLVGGVVPAAKPDGFQLPFDPVRLVAAVCRRWVWVLVSGLAAGGLAGVSGYFKLEPQFTASAQLMRQEPAGTFRASQLGEPFKPRQLSVPTLVSLMRSPAVLQATSELTQPRLSVRAILAGLTINPERNTDLISVSFRSSRSDQAAMRVVNLFGTEVVRLTREMQGQEAAEVNRLLRKQVAKTEEDLREVNSELLAFSKDAGLIDVDKEIDAYLRKLGELDLRHEAARIDYETLDLRIAALEKELSEHNPVLERVRVARDRLSELLTQFTEANPLVAEQRERLAAAERDLGSAAGMPITPPRQGESSLVAGFYQELVTLRTQKEVLKAQLEKLASTRASVDDRLRLLPEKGMHYARIKARQQSLETSQSLLASRQREAQLYEESPMGYYRFFECRPDQVEVAGRGKRVLMIAVAGGILGSLLCMAFVGLTESLDDRVKTVADVKRATRLPVLARLPELETMDAVERSSWAFRTWMALQTTLSSGTDRELVCGFGASSAGEGTSTWIDLLGRAAAQGGRAVVLVSNSSPREGISIALDAAITTPSLVIPRAEGVIPVEMPAHWRWDAARRRQWQAALALWRRVPGLVVLIELSHMDQPDTLLLAESLPQMIWVTCCGKARAPQTQERLDLVRHSGCRPAGVAVNRHKRLLPLLPSHA
jgi:uncharacterized protein involved in exopolysaccharide biosynthesis